MSQKCKFFAIKKSPLSVKKSHNTVKLCYKKSQSSEMKSENCKFFVIKSHNLVTKSHKTISFCYEKSQSSLKKSRNVNILL